MKKKNWLWLGIGLTVVVLQLLYLPTRRAGFVTDFTGLAERIETYGAAGIISSFDFPALQPITSLFYYFFYKGYSLDGWGWYLSFTLLHTGNAIFLFFLVRRLLYQDSPDFVAGRDGLPGLKKDLADSNAQPVPYFSQENLMLHSIKGDKAFTRTLVAASGALLFLFSPFATEVVVWRVGFHYILVTFFIQAMLWQVLRWLKNPQSSTFWSIMTLQLAGLLTYELAIIAPLFSLSLIFWFHHDRTRINSLQRLAIPQFSLLGLYFIANRAFLGTWIGHYGSDIHLNFPVTELIANVGRYFVKLAGFSRYWAHPWKESLAIWLQQPAGITLLIVLSLALLGWMVKSFRRSDRKTQLVWIFGLATFIALIPVLNLYFNYLLHIENDRYGYLPALFFYPAWMALLSRLPRGIFIFLAAAYLLISIGLLHRTNQFWAQSTSVYLSLIKDFPGYDQDTTYLLNLPDNFQGAPMFRDFSGKDRAFADALQYVNRRPYEGTLEEVVQYNMVSPTDGVQVEPDSSSLKITFKQWGNWWWRRGIGASSYRDSTFIFHNEGHHYRLEWIKQPQPKNIWYQDGPQWKSWKDQ